MKLETEYILSIDSSNGTQIKDPIRYQNNGQSFGKAPSYFDD